LINNEREDATSSKGISEWRTSILYPVE